MGGCSIPAVERAVAGVIDVVEALAELDHVLVSTAALDDDVSQVAGQPVDVDRRHGDGHDALVRTAGFELLAHLGRVVPLQQDCSFMWQQFERDGAICHVDLYQLSPPLV